MTPTAITTDRWCKLDVVRLQIGGAQVTVSHWGAHVLSWIPSDGVERLYLSPRTQGDGLTPIRGGIPVIFPQWADQGPHTRHGFARRVLWQLTEQKQDPAFVFATWRLTHEALPTHHRDEIPSGWWAEVTVMLSPERLDVELAVGNDGAAPLAFTGGLHTYLATQELELSQLSGLYGLTYRDANANWQEVKETAPELVVDRAVNRVYPAPTRALLWKTGKVATGIDQAGFANLVVWNPGENHTLADLPADGFRRFLCVEAAQLTEPVTLDPGAEWAGRQSLVALPSL